MIFYIQGVALFIFSALGMLVSEDLVVLVYIETCIGRSRLGLNQLAVKKWWPAYEIFLKLANTILDV